MKFSLLFFISVLLLLNLIESFKFQHSTLFSTKIGNKYYSTVDPIVEVEKAVYITPTAMSQLSGLKNKQNEPKVLRMGVKSGGCSGMSYTMDFITQEKVSEDDYIEEFDSLKCVIDPKSMLYIYGLHLDYSDELIGGGFKFTNPNAEKSCGCGKSFGV